MHCRSTAPWHFPALVAVLFAMVAGCNSSGNRDGDAANSKLKRLVILINGYSPYWDAAARA